MVDQPALFFLLFEYQNLPTGQMGTKIRIGNDVLYIPHNCLNPSTTCSEIAQLSIRKQIQKLRFDNGSSNTANGSQNERNDFQRNQFSRFSGQN